MHRWFKTLVRYTKTTFIELIYGVKTPCMCIILHVASASTRRNANRTIQLMRPCMVEGYLYIYTSYTKLNYYVTNIFQVVQTHT